MPSMGVRSLPDVNGHRLVAGGREAWMDLLDMLLDHDHWATRQLLDTSAGLPDAQWDQPFDIGHRTLRETFGHMIFNLPFWTALMTGQTTDGVVSTDSQPADRSPAALIEAHEQGYAAFAAVLRRLRDEGRLDAVYADHYGVRKSNAGTMLMIVEHNVEHRSEILHILARLGVPDVPEVDPGVWEYWQLNR